MASSSAAASSGSGGAPDAGTPCTVDTDCPLPAYECQQRACNSGQCTFTNLPSGTAIGLQTADSCATVVCDGAGRVTLQADPNDLPIDDKACTQDLCIGLMPSNPPLASGTSCSGGWVCNGAGACVRCLAAADCPAPTNACLVATCLANACGFAPAAPGTPAPNQAPGDCQTVVCDGVGGITTQANSTDLPGDDNPCTDDVCTGMTPSNPPLAPDAACNGANVCDGAGRCVECNAAAQCPVGNECMIATCTNHACGFTFTAAGTALAVQTPGDCVTAVCDGSGTITQQAAASDLPVDGNPCTDDVCTGTTPSNPATAADASCGGANVCDGSGNCVRCTRTAQCPAGPSVCAVAACNAGLCELDFPAAGTAIAAQVGGDCKQAVCDGNGNVASQADPADLPVDSNPCTDDVCTGSTPSNPPLVANTSCGGQNVCDGSGQCVRCNLAAQCPPGSGSCQIATCTGHVCGFATPPLGTAISAQVAGDCKTAVCDGMGNVTQQAAVSDLPNDSDPCTNDVCTGTTPSNPLAASGTSCGAGANVCNGGGECVRCTLDSHCPAGANECQVATCSSNTCVFTNRAAGTVLSAQTTGDCKRAVCDGAGGISNQADGADVPDDANACTEDRCTAGVPSNLPRASGVSCGAPNVCDGSGACVRCTLASQCPAGTNEAQVPACVSNTCTINYLPYGTGVVDQVTGDCKTRVADGVGGITEIAAASDVPIDGNPCTDDICTGTVPSNPSSSAGTACPTGQCDGTGACVECLANSDCPSGESACQVGTCTVGVCLPTPAGTPAGGEIPFDCKRHVCDGAGGSELVNFMDPPFRDPMDFCRMPTCNDGTPGYDNMPSGILCFRSLDPLETGYCDGAGSCGQCATVADCPGPTNPCQLTSTCTAGTCGYLTYPAGPLPLFLQSAGDCQTASCLAGGMLIQAPDVTDIQNDGNDCTLDYCGPTGMVHEAQPLFYPCGGGMGQCNGAGSCSACTSDQQCGGGGPCTVARCMANACTLQNVPFGQFAMTLQPAGDCSKVVCDGLGGTTVQADAADVPNDGDACTADLCLGTMPSNPPASAGTACAGGYCSGSGSCVQCTQDSHCSGGNACRTAVCTNSTCGFTSVAAGTVITDQSDGDCATIVCDGSGGFSRIEVSTDMPDDGNPCTTDGCSGAYPTLTPLSAGTNCGGGNVCDGAGNCAQCTSAAQCPSNGTGCETATCTAGVCGLTRKGYGSAANQTAGDCLKAICDGSGGVLYQAELTDVPVDGNACTQDVCTSSPPIAYPSNPPRAPDTSCGGANVCDGAGSCVQCNSPSQCPQGANGCEVATCTAGACGFSYPPDGTLIGTQTEGDCRTMVCDGAGAIVARADSTDALADANPCTDDYCMGINLVHPPKALDAACGGGWRCDGAGACVQCTAATQCPDGPNECWTRSCTAGRCALATKPDGTLLASQVAGNCRQEVCNASGGITYIPDGADIPVDGNLCTSDGCYDTLLWPGNPPVAIDTPCGGSNLCDGAGNCVGCTSAAQCPQGPDACTVATCNGTCGFTYPVGNPVPNQTAGDCRKTVCNGSGGTIVQADATDVPIDGNLCTADVCNGSTPSNPPVAAGTSCGPSRLCDGAGTCVCTPTTCANAAACKDDCGQPNATLCARRYCSGANSCEDSCGLPWDYCGGCDPDIPCQTVCGVPNQYCDQRGDPTAWPYQGKCHPTTGCRDVCGKAQPYCTPECPGSDGSHQAYPTSNGALCSGPGTTCAKYCTTPLECKDNFGEFNPSVCGSSTCHPTEACKSACGTTNNTCTLGGQCSATQACKDVCGGTDSACATGCADPAACEDNCGELNRTLCQGLACHPTLPCRDSCGLPKDGCGSLCPAGNACYEGECRPCNEAAYMFLRGTTCVNGAACTDGCGGYNPSLCREKACSSTTACTDSCGNPWSACDSAAVGGEQCHPTDECRNVCGNVQAKDPSGRRCFGNGSSDVCGGIHQQCKDRCGNAADCPLSTLPNQVTLCVAGCTTTNRGTGICRGSGCTRDSDCPISGMKCSGPDGAGECYWQVIGENP